MSHAQESLPIRGDRNWPHLLGAAILLVVIVVPLSLYGLVTYITSPIGWPTEEFSTTSWKETQSKGRYAYYKDLRQKRLLDGATRDRVVELLGKPDYASPEGRYYVYVVKNREEYEPSFNSVYALRVNFSEDDRVMSYEIRAD